MSWYLKGQYSLDSYVLIGVGTQSVKLNQLRDPDMSQTNWLQCDYNALFGVSIGVWQVHNAGT